MSIFIPTRMQVGQNSINGFTRPMKPARTMDLLTELLNTRLFCRKVTGLYFDDIVLRKYTWLSKSIEPLDNVGEIFFDVHLEDYLDDDVEIVIKIKRWVQEYLSTQRFIFSSAEKRQQLEKIERHCLKKLNITVSNPLPEQFSGEELKTLDITQRIVSKFRNLLCPRKLSCYEFALLKSNEHGVRELLFNYPRNDTTSFFQDLPRWGFDVVTDPQAKDLVLYIHRGVPKHMGLLINSTHALSKGGNASQTVMLHAIEQSGSEDGFQIVFYRKTRVGRYQTIFPVLEDAKHDQIHFTGEGLE